MTAGGKVEPHEGVARLHQRHEHFGIGRRAGMRLHVGEAAAEQFGHPLDREPLDNVDELAAAVIALARQAFGIFVGQHRALRLKHRAADDIFRRDQLDLVALAAEFLADRIGDLRIAFAERGGEKSLLRKCCTMRDRHAVAPRQRWLVIPRRRGRRARNPYSRSVAMDSGLVVEFTIEPATSAGPVGSARNNAIARR